MEFIIFVIFWACLLSLIFHKVKSGKVAKWSRLFRIVTIIFSISFFVYWFIEESTTTQRERSIQVQVINKLPQALDFYLISVDKAKRNTVLKSKYIGKIRPQYYRTEHLKKNISNEYWIAGYSEIKGLVYFSPYYISSNSDIKSIKVLNYINQNVKLSEAAKQQIRVYRYENTKLGIWVTLVFLLLFLNIILFLRKNK